MIREEKVNDLVYRFGYQGQYAEKDEETGWNHFELREYDPVVGRWMVVDPKRQFFSPYVGMGNNPIGGIDPDGGGVLNDYTMDVDGNIIGFTATDDNFDRILDLDGNQLYKTTDGFHFDFDISHLMNGPYEDYLRGDKFLKDALYLTSWSSAMAGYYATYREAKAWTALYQASLTNPNWLYQSSGILGDAKLWNFAGKGFFVGGAMISSLQFAANPTASQAVQSGKDIGFGALGVWGGPPGVFFSGVYFLDLTVRGWVPSYDSFRSEQERITPMLNRLQNESMVSQGIYWR